MWGFPGAACKISNALPRAPAEARFKTLKANNTSRPKRDAQGRVVHPPWDPTPLGVAARELSF